MSRGASQLVLFALDCKDAIILEDLLEARPGVVGEGSAT